MFLSLLPFFLFPIFPLFFPLLFFMTLHTYPFFLGCAGFRPLKKNEKFFNVLVCGWRCSLLCLFACLVLILYNHWFEGGEDDDDVDGGM